MTPFDELSSRKRELAEKLLRKKLGDTSRLPIARRADGTTAPLSYTQEQLWVLQRVNPDDRAYNLTFVLRFPDVDEAALRRTLSEIVRRHEGLRTVFPVVDGHPVQLVQEDHSLRLDVLDLPEMSEEAQHAELRRIGLVELRRAVDLERGPIARGLLVRPAVGAAQLLLLSIHHIAIDEWSTGILVDEIQRLYAAFAAGADSPLQDLPIQYGDFAAWQRDSARKPIMDAQLAYWKRELADLRPMRLSIARDRPAEPTLRSERRSLLLPAPLTKALREFSRRQGLTLFSTLLAGFSALLERYSGQEDVAIGSPAANRERAETENLIGFFVNMVVLRTPVRPQESFRDLARRAHAVVAGALAHEDVPFERLVSELAPQRTYGENPLFQITFDLRHDTVPSGLELTMVVDEVESTRFDLEVHAFDDGHRIRLNAVYSSDLFEGDAVATLLRHFETLLESAMAHDQRPVETLQMLSEDDLRCIGRAPRPELPRAAESLIAAFERHATERPDAVATEGQGDTLTYGQLNNKANRLAHALRARGVRRGSIVAICLERGHDFVVSLLAVMKAGAAYVPLDPDYPMPRLEFMLNDCGAAIALTHMRLKPVLLECLAARAAGSSTLEIVCLDESASLFECQAGTNLNVPVSHDDTAYMIYTSGSTGRPKGVLVPHRGLSNVIAAQAETFGVGPADRVLQFSSPSFDASVFDVAMALGSGATLLVPPREDVLPGPGLGALLSRERVSVLTITPSALTATPVVDAPNLRVVSAAGEACPAQLVRGWGSGRRFFNLYGPTEGTIWTTAVECTGDRVPTIGRAISNVSAYVADSRLRLLAPGMAGELLIGGEGVARGYLGRPALTAERFIPDPISGVAGARLYRSGDLARYSASGEIEYLGRADQQVKLRGFRIELGDIDEAIRQHPGVMDAATIVHEDANGHRRLVAYCVGREGADVTSSQLARFVKQSLPLHMFPAVFVLVDALPLTPNGKLNRVALPDPDGARMREEPNRAVEVPQNATEKTLAAIWADVLRLGNVGVHDNFFELGGDSILSLQIVSRAQASGVRLTAKDLFKHQTIAELASVAQIDGAAPGGDPAAPDAAPLVPVQQWFFQQAFADPHYFNQAVALDAARPVSPSVVERALRELVSHHDALRLRVTDVEGKGLQRVASVDESAASFTVIDVSHLSEPEQGSAIEAAASRLQAGLSLDGPLVSAALFQRGTRAQTLFVAIHHLAVDGVSWRVLIEDLDLACRQLSDGKAVQLPPKTTAYLRWAERLNAYAQSCEAVDAARFWSSQPPDATIPLDDHSGLSKNTVGEMATVTVALTDEETDALLHKSPRAFRTQINDVLLTAAALALSRWAGRPSVSMNLEGHGREDLFGDVDLSRTVGWCTSLFPVSLAVPASDDPIEALKLVKEQLRAVPDHGIGFGVARYLSDDPEVRSALAARTEPQVSFNYLGRFDQSSHESALWKTAALSTGVPCSPRGHRPHLIDIIGSVREGRLAMHWHYCPHVHRRKTVERVAADFLARVREIVGRTASTSERGATPSDFPLVSLDQPAVDRLCVRYPDLEDIYALSPLQEGLLFHTLLDPQVGAYVEQLTTTFDGDLNVDAIRRAWQLAVDRHAILRSAFVWSELDVPVQVVRRRVEVPWSMEDWRGENRTEQVRLLEARRDKERFSGFDLAEAPALRLTVVRLADHEYCVILTFHHLLLDGWSMQILFKEVSELYLALAGARAPSLPPARPYRAYIEWLNENRNSAQAEAFWRRQLDEGPDSTTLNLPRPEAASTAYSEQWLRLSEEDTERLRAAARRHQLTLNSFVQVAWALLLARYTGQDDVIFGAMVSGRPSGLAHVESMVGLFINTMPVCVRLPRDRSLLSVMRDVQDQQVAAREFEHVRLSDIQRWSGSPSGDGWFDTLLAFENYPVDRLSISGGEVSVRDVQVTEQTHYALTAVVVPGVQLAVRVGFDSARFARGTVGEMLDRLGLAFERLAATPEMFVRDVSLMRADEREAILALGTGAAVDYPPVLTVDGLFEQQAVRYADREAVRCGTESLTYRQLDERANQWAHVLQRHGVGPDVVVGVCLEGGVELIAVLLGIIKAGGAYLALDPAYPTSRLRLMLDDTRASLVVTDGASSERLSLGKDVSVLQVDRLRSTIDREPSTRVSAAIEPEHLAYVSYTSGSTGRPKGVGVPHRGIVRLLFGVDYASFGPDHTWLQLAPVGFDASTLEIWGAMLHGGRLVVATDRMPTPESLGALLAAERVTSLWLTASLFNAVIDTAPDALRPVRQLLIGGEALSVPHVRTALDALPGTRIINGYGPTESTTFTCCHPITRDDAGYHTRSIPIGRPIGHTHVYVLDAGGDPAPVGVVGELFVGGDGLSRGYVGQPARSAERFVPDPHSVVPGARLYRTGDRVRWTPRGVLEFVGRVDTQVKVRGFRVEPAEIEVVIGRHPPVQASAVVVREDIPGARRLVAYVVAKEGAPFDEEDLRQHLKRHLPDYMIPASFVLMGELPRTPNGKLDREALPAPEALRADSRRQPSTPAEVALAAIWADVLAAAQIGTDENYFELGGDSILSIQICSRAQRAGWDLTPKQLFEHQTIAGAASVMRRRAVVGGAGVEVSGQIAMLPAQRWFFEQEFADPHHFTQGMMLDVDARVSVPAIDRALHALVAHHDVLRARFNRTESGWTQNILPSKPPAIGLVSRVELSPKERSAPSAAIERAAIAVQASLDLESGPLLRAVVFEAPEMRSRLLLVIHHLLVDAVSWRVLLEDLELACRQIRRDEPVQLPARTSSVREWAQALADYARTPSLGSAREWWLSAAAVQAHPLPVDYPGGTASNTAGSSARVSVALNEADTRALLQAVPRAYFTQINDALLTALVQAIAPWAQSNTVLIDLEGHGREAVSDAADLTRTLGWFTSITPVPLSLPADGDTGAALRAVKEQLRALPGGTLAYGALRYFSPDAGTKASLAAGARPEVAFNYLGQVDRIVPGDALFRVASESSGPTSSPRQRRPHLVDVVGFVKDDQLRFEWIYSPHVHGRGTVEALARRFSSALRAIIAHCEGTQVAVHTPSDFPLASVDQRGLDMLRARYAGRAITDLYPASPLQQGMLFHSLAAPNSSVFATQVCCEFAGDLDVAALRRAWSDALGRHAILRTAFIIDGVDEFHQVVFENVSLPWVEEDWSARAVPNRDAAFADWLRDDRARGFDIAQAPLMRLAVIKRDRGRHCLVWTHHHALLDGWSFAIVLGEVFAAYQLARDGASSAHAHRPPYRDYIAWLQRQDRGAAERYWRHALAGFTGATTLSVDEAPGSRRSGVETHDEQVLYVDEAATRRIEALAHELRITLNTVVQGAWALLLSRYSGETDVVFGTTVSGRPADLPGVEEMIGLFMNGLPLRVEVRQQQPVRDWLQALQQQHLEMRQFEGAALLDIQGWSDVPRGAPLFETTLVFENYPEGESLRSDVRGAGMSSAQVVSNTSSALHLRAIPGRRLALRLVHDQQRFSGDTARRMVRQLEHVLHAFAEHSRKPLGSLSLVTVDDVSVLPDARLPLPSRWSGAVHEEISRCAAAWPDRSAIVDRGGVRSYAQVERRSNQIAQALHSSGVQRGEVVAILAERGAALVEGALGVMKAGAAFVFLDLAYPASRLIDLATIANARGVIRTSESISDDLLRGLADLQPRIDLSITGGSALDAYPATGLDVHVGPDDLAYIAFTSGSTGRPKGVLGLHGPLAQFARSAAEQFGLGLADRFAALSALSHDPLLRDLFPPLQLGATLHMPDSALMGTPSRLVHWMHTSGVTTCNLTPALARLLTDVEDIQVPSLRRAFVVGEVLTAGDVARLKRMAPHVSCVNFYGSTETQQALAWQAADDAAAGSRLPIGRGMDGVQLLVLNDGGELAGVGEVGEICVRTPYLARGYLDDSLTAERFQQNPLSQEPNDRVYRSGDRGRYRSDGAVAYVGRRDAQVKIRGFRVEPAEVETVLMSHEGVREAAVVPYGSDRDDRVLVGYVVGTADATELRSFMSARLPAAMVPAHFVTLDRLPRTASGKINRLALPEAEPRDEGPIDAAPMSPFEETLAGFWKELLNIQSVGADASFFDLGGHSLLAARLIARVRDEFQIEMPIGALFEHPTIAGFAVAITRVLLADDGRGDELIASIKDLSDQSIQDLINEDASLVGDGGSE